MKQTRLVSNGYRCSCCREGSLIEEEVESPKYSIHEVIRFSMNHATFLNDFDELETYSIEDNGILLYGFDVRWIGEELSYLKIFNKTFKVFKNDGDFTFVDKDDRENILTYNDVLALYHKLNNQHQTRKQNDNQNPDHTHNGNGNRPSTECHYSSCEP